jgi:hypothetical protein
VGAVQGEAVKRRGVHDSTSVGGRVIGLLGMVKTWRRITGGGARRRRAELMVVLLMSVMGARLRGSYRLARWFGVGVTDLLTVATLTIALLRWAYPGIRHESGRSGNQFVPGNRSS